MAANGHIIDDLPERCDARPSPPMRRRAAAQQVIEKYRPIGRGRRRYSEPRAGDLQSRSVVGYGRTSSLAAGLVRRGHRRRRCASTSGSMRSTGAMLLHFSQLTEAKSRRSTTANSGSTLPGTLVRAEGGAADRRRRQDNAYDYAGDTYDYFFTNHGRDSYDGAGAASLDRPPLHYLPAGIDLPDTRTRSGTATQMVYGDGFSSADDVVAHELTHAVTERTADLFYYMQSGALNESFSDIFGETVDLTERRRQRRAGVRWQIGEDVPHRRDPRHDDPDALRHPGKMSDSALHLQQRAPATRSTATAAACTQQRRPQPRLRADGRRRHLQRHDRHRHRPDQGGQDPVPRADGLPHVGLRLPRQLQRAQSVLHRPDRHRRHHRGGLHAGQQGAAGGRDEQHLACAGAALRRRCCPAGAAVEHVLRRRSRAGHRQLDRRPTPPARGTPATPASPRAERCMAYGDDPDDVSDHRLDHDRRPSPFPRAAGCISTTRSSSRTTPSTTTTAACWSTAPTAARPGSTPAA